MTTLSDVFVCMSLQVPPRPAGQRTEPENNTGFPGFGFGDGFHMSFGIGAFPFGVFTSTFNFGDPRPSAGKNIAIFRQFRLITNQVETDFILEKIFFYCTFLALSLPTHTYNFNNLTL